MEYRKLGNSGLQISALSFGTWLTFGKQIGDDTADQLITLAYEQGINFFDNAETYAKGKSEEVLGSLLKKKNWARSSYLVSSKVFYGYEDNLPNQRGLSRKHVIEGCDAALMRLQLSYLDLFYCHRPDKNTPIAETVFAMNTLIQQGKILYWGTSEWTAAEIVQAHLEAVKNNLIPPVMEQPQYNLFSREKMEKEYIHLFQYQGIGTTIWSPLASGLLSGKYNESDPGNTRLSMKGMEWLRDKQLVKDKIETVKKLVTLAKEINVTLPQLSIAWCLKNKNVSSVILGA
ncbi:MAG: aldo/keto reductase, partial [Bacteroidota bacterium]